MARQKGIVFIDGQNLFHRAKCEFGHQWPNYDPVKLARLLCRRVACELSQVRFYSGVPSPMRDPYWHGWWANKCLAMSRADVQVITRPLRAYDNGRYIALLEKGIDVRIAMDMVRVAREGEVSHLILVSCDQDFVEVANELRRVSRPTGRELKIVSAYPDANGQGRGIYNTDWLPLSAKEYEACLDLRNYRPSERQMEALTASQQQRVTPPTTDSPPTPPRRPKLARS